MNKLLPLRWFSDVLPAAGGEDLLVSSIHMHLYSRPIERTDCEQAIPLILEEFEAALNWFKS